jgi:hypothetical protein
MTDVQRKKSRLLRPLVLLLIAAAVLLLLTGGIGIYRSVQYGYICRNLSSDGTTQLHCFVQSTHRQARYGPVLVESNDSPFFLVVQCYEIVGANAAQLRLKHVSAAVSSVPSGPHSVHEVSGELLSTLRFTIQPDGMTAKAVLPERYEGNGAISADLTIRAISASGAPIDINAKGRTLPPRETIRAYPYLWVLIRRQWSG